MASQTINGGVTFAEGTSVGAYPATQIGPNGGPPTGSATTTATVTGGVLSFTGLADGTEYVAYAAGPDRYKRFRTDPPAVSAGSGGEPLTTIASASGTVPLAANADRAGFDLTLTGNTTLSQPTGTQAGKVCTVELWLTQDSTGGRSVTWWSGITWLQGAPPTIPAGPGLTLFVTLLTKDGGTTWFGSYQGLMAWTGGPHPARNGFIAWTDPPEATNGAFALPSGTMTLGRIVAPAGPITNLHAYSQQAGTGLTLGKMALYDTAGNLLASSANQAALVQAAGLQTIPLTAPYSWRGGALYVASLPVGTTATKLWYSGGSSTTNGSANVAPAGAQAAEFSIASLADIPATVTVPTAAVAGADALYWKGLS